MPHSIFYRSSAKHTGMTTKHVSALVPTLFALMALGNASLACAQSADGVDTAGPAHAREGGSVSLAVASRADYYGGEDGRISAKPALEYHWANGWMAGTDRGVGYNFSQDPNLQFGLGLGMDFGRQETATGPLAGMGSIDATVQYGAFVNYALDRNWRLSSALKYGAGESGQGASADFGVNYGLDIAPKWRLGLGLSTTWSNSQYMQSYFGVNATQSQQSGHAQYSPSAGLSDLGASVKLTYEIAPKVSVSGGFTATSLLGDARNSPLVNRPDSVSGSLTVVYAF